MTEKTYGVVSAKPDDRSYLMRMPGMLTAVEVFDNPPPGFAMRVYQVAGQVGGPVFLNSGFNNQIQFLDINVPQDLWISTDVPCTVSIGCESGPGQGYDYPDTTLAQAIGSWWDKWARPRRVSNLNGVQVRVTTAQNGVVIIWGAAEIHVGPYSE